MYRSPWLVLRLLASGVDSAPFGCFYILTLIVGGCAAVGKPVGAWDKAGGGTQLAY